MLKSCWVLLVLILVSCSSKREVFLRTVSDTTAVNGVRFVYSYDSYTWYKVDSVLKLPLVGEGSIKDPSLTKDRNGVYHASWVAVKNGKEGLAHATTEDFKTWSIPVFVRLVETDSSQIGVNTPRLLFDELTDTCLVYWSSARQGRTCVFALRTVDFKQFTSFEKLYDPGFAVEDPCLIRRAQNDYVLIVNDVDPIESNLKVAFSNRLEGPYERLSPSFTAFQTRNPSVTKIGAKWHIFYQDYGNNQIKVVTTLDFDSFEDITQETSIPNHAGGGDIVQISRKNHRKLLRYLHCKPVKEKK